MKRETLKVNSLNEDNYSYTYCKNGNLERVYNGNTQQVEYRYDANGRLISEYNYLHNINSEYKYDTSGNILSKTIGGTTYGYTYASEGWKDRLTSYNGKEITYDAMGNPTNYMGKAMQWRGRRLINADGVAMEYDYNGQRVKKGDRRYYWQGDRLKAERWEENYIYYYYDESGVSGINYNGTEYYYRKNVMWYKCGCKKLCPKCLTIYSGFNIINKLIW